MVFIDGSMWFIHVYSKFIPYVLSVVRPCDSSVVQSELMQASVTMRQTITLGDAQVGSIMIAKWM